MPPTINEAVEYIMYILPYQATYDNLFPLFKARDIYIDKTFVRKIQDIQRLYLQIRQMYKNNDAQVTQFIDATKSSIITNKIQNFESFGKYTPIVRNFYYSILDLTIAMTKERYSKEFRHLERRGNAILDNLKMEKRLANMVLSYDAMEYFKEWSIKTDIITAIILPDDRFAVAHHHGVVSIYQGPNEILSRNLNSDIIYTMTYLPNNKIVISYWIYNGCGIAIWDIDSNKIIANSKLNQRTINNIYVLPNGNILAIDILKEIFLMDPQLNILKSIPLENIIVKAKVLSDGLIVILLNNHKVKLYNSDLSEIESYISGVDITLLPNETIALFPPRAIEIINLRTQNRLLIGVDFPISKIHSFPSNDILVFGDSNLIVRVDLTKIRNRNNLAYLSQDDISTLSIREYGDIKYMKALSNGLVAIGTRVWWGEGHDYLLIYDAYNNKVIISYETSVKNVIELSDGRIAVISDEGITLLSY